MQRRFTSRGSSLPILSLIDADNPHIWARPMMRRCANWWTIALRCSLEEGIDVFVSLS